MGESLNGMDRFLMDLRERYGHDTDGRIEALEQALKIAFIMSQDKGKDILKVEEAEG